MALKKSELYSSLWASCDELRGSMDASQYKDYVLVLLFVKYISDKYGNSDDFKPAVVNPAGSSIKDMITLNGSAEIGDKINTQIIAPLIAAKTQRKTAQDALDKEMASKCPILTEAQIKTLVVDDKWMAHLAVCVQGELDRVSQTLTGRIRELAERYVTPLPRLSDEVTTLAARVEEHLKRMGAVWN